MSLFTLLLFKNVTTVNTVAIDLAMLLYATKWKTIGTMLHVWLLKQTKLLIIIITKHDVCTIT